MQRVIQRENTPRPQRRKAQHPPPPPPPPPHPPGLLGLQDQPKLEPLEFEDWLGWATQTFEKKIWEKVHKINLNSHQNL